jgi:hypothetical protein
MSKKTLLIIAAVAVMLAGATSAYGYQEYWEGWFNSGYLILSTSSPPRVDTFHYTTGESILEDHTVGDVDEFHVPSVTPSTFTCYTEPYMGCYIKVWSNPSGSKDTGQEDQKEVNRGATWTGTAILYQPGKDPEEFDVEGTWNTEDAGDCFDYTDYPEEDATYSAHWVMNYSDPDRLRGEGGSAGTLQEE